jgi:hypothetical protein
VLAPIPNAIVAENSLLSFFAVATDYDLPPQALAFSLPGAPAGATIHPASGLFTWTPNATQGGVTNVLKVVVTDNGPASLSATQTFSVIVLDTQPDFQVSLGTTQLLAGAAAAMPLALQSGLDLTNVQWVLALDGDRLENLALQNLAAQVGTAELLPLGSNHYTARFGSQPGGVLQGSLALAQLAFTTAADGPSAIVNLGVEALTGARASSAAPVNAAGTGGRVFVVADEPLLDAAGGEGEMRLRLYARPGSSLELSRSTNLLGNDWTVVLLTPHSNLVQEVPLPATLARAFYRAASVEPDPPQIVLAGAAADRATLVVHGRRGGSYVVEATGELLGKGGWVAWTNGVSTNAFQFFHLERGPEPLRLFRVRRE